MAVASVIPLRAAIISALRPGHGPPVEPRSILARASSKMRMVDVCPFQLASNNGVRLKKRQSKYGLGLLGASVFGSDLGIALVFGVLL